MKVDRNRARRGAFRVVGLALAVLPLLATAALAENATIRWKHPGTTPVDGFRVYLSPDPGGTATNPTADVDVGLPTRGSDGVYSTELNIADGTLYVSVRAYNSAGLSAPSNEVAYVDGQVPLGVPGTPQVVSVP